MQGKRVLFFDPDPKAIQIAERAIAATGSEVVAIRREAELTAADLAMFDLVVLTMDAMVGLNEQGRQVMERALALYPRTKLLLHVKESSERYIELMTEHPFLRNIVAKRQAPLDAEEIIVTTEKLLRADLFGLEKYLLWGVQAHRIVVKDSRDKVAYVREVSELAEQLGCSQRIIELVETVVDELSTNAIFNAPRDAAGRPKYAHLNRREAVALSPDEEAELIYACDGNYFAIAQRDRFGSLTRETVVSYLDRCLKRGPGQLLHGAGGAGIGLFRVYKSLSKFIINLRPGHLTEVIGLIDLRLSIKQFKLQPKSLHFFIEDAEEKA